MSGEGSSDRERVLTPRTNPEVHPGSCVPGVPRSVSNAGGGACILAGGQMGLWRGALSQACPPSTHIASYQGLATDGAGLPDGWRCEVIAVYQNSGGLAACRMERMP